HGVYALFLQRVQHAAGEVERFEAEGYFVLGDGALHRLHGGDGQHRGGFLVLQNAVAAEHAELGAQRIDGHVERVARLHAAIGPDAQGQPVEVRLLAHARVFHTVGNAPHGGVDGVDGDGVNTVLGAVDLGGHVAHAALHAHLHD